MTSWPVSGRRKMMTRNEKLPTLDDVLNEFVAGHERPTAEALEAWVRRYPQFRNELIEFAAAWAEQMVLPAAPELSTDEEERIVDRAMSHALNISFSRDEQVQSHQPNENAIKSLTAEAKKAGLSAPEFAKACGLDLVLIAKLNTRQIRPNTIPPKLISHVARLLGRTIEAVTEYLGQPPQPLADRSFLALEKPKSAGQESFADAVRASSLSEAEKARWLDEADEREER